jgi:hypothetical protein
MFKNTVKTTTVVLAAGAVLVLGAGPAAARSSYGAAVDNQSGSRYESNFVQTPSGNLIVQYNEHSGSNDRSSSTRSSSHGQETMSSDGTKESHFSMSYPDGSGGSTDYSSHYANGNVQSDKYRSK